MPPKVMNPTKELKNIRMVIKGDTTKWLKKVKTLVDNGADPHVLDDYKGNGSIICEYLKSDIDEESLCKICKFLFDQGLTPTSQIFVDCLYSNHLNVADIVLLAARNANITIDVNKLDMYGIAVHEWTALALIKKKAGSLQYDIVKYLKSKGLNTSTKNFSIDDIMNIINSTKNTF